MNVLLLGSGGREHALAWKISQSTLLSDLYIAPGNSGTALHGTNINLKLNNFSKIGKFALEKNISMVVVGPEAPLVEGIWDYFKQSKKLAHITVIGPSREGARLEGSKDFAKEFMKKYSIPTAKFETFDSQSLKQGMAYIDSKKGPYVLKADGLAAGKGVLIVDDPEDAKKELKSMIKGGKFGEAGNKVVVEQFLKGTELSVFVLTDGMNYKLFPTAKDYKRIGEGDTGLNTGGMGALSPAPGADMIFMKRVEQEVIVPTLRGIESEGIDYQGFIFFGLMNVKGNPYVIEYNVRLGDPETQIVLPRVKSDLLDLFEGISSGTFSEKDINISSEVGAAVVMVSGGYPGDYEKNKKIHGVDEIDKSLVFHAGMKEKQGHYFTNGGRVLSMVVTSKNLERALQKIYLNIEKIKFSKNYYRKDIGYEVLETVT